MISVSTFQGSVAVYGLGVSGLSCVRALLAGGSQVLAWDDNKTRREQAQALGAKIDNLEILPAGLEALVLSPGIALTHPEPHPVVSRAQDANIEIIGDMELFQRAMTAYGSSAKGACVIAITGTNGKSTTTALTAHLLQAQGLDVQMGGNIGKPVLDLEPPSDMTVYVLELSSYQIDLAPGFKADIAVLLNLSPDHIERHGSFENYKRAKWKLFENMSSNGLAILSLDDAPCKTLSQEEGARLAAQTLSFSCHVKADYFASATTLFDANGAVVDIAHVPSLQGQHNMQNALAAYAAASQVCQDRRALGDAFESFPGLVHRLQQVGQAGLVRFINDSKATNAAATRHALSAYENIYWIAGGQAKQEGIQPLMETLKGVCKAYLIGDAAQDYAATLSGHVPCVLSKTLEQAVPQAAHDAQSSGGGVVLLSPASASFDQFENFEKRGEAFCQIVDKYLERHLGEESA